VKGKVSGGKKKTARKTHLEAEFDCSMEIESARIRGERQRQRTVGNLLGVCSLIEISLEIQHRLKSENVEIKFARQPVCIGRSVGL
jgi:hypothetical protein